MAHEATRHHRNLLGLLREARTVLNRQLWPYLRLHGLSITELQWRVIRTLTSNELHIQHGVETGRIAKDARILPPSLSGILTRMERDGMLTRERAPNDARLSLVKPTQKSLDIVQSMRAPLAAYYEWLEEQIGADDIGQLYRLLDTIIRIGPDARPPNVKMAQAPVRADKKTARKKSAG
jgi:homoprotocatechuate degradation regulator HpaR